MPDRLGRGKSVATIPASAPFADTLAAWLLRETAKRPDLLADYTILLPNRRAVRALREAFLRATDGTALLLPSIRPIGDVDGDSLQFSGSDISVDVASDSLEPPIADIERQAILATLVGRWAKAREDRMSAAKAWRLAGALARFIDSCDIAEVDMADLVGLAADDLAGHWLITLEFLTLVTRELPGVLVQMGCQSPAVHRSALLDMLAEKWRLTPPSGPVIAAGSTGSMPATRRLLDCVASLENGLVILPGFDRDMDEDAWQALDATHPQWLMKIFVETIGVDRAEVDIVTHEAMAGHLDARKAVLEHALLPADVSDRWYRQPLQGDVVTSGLSKVSLIVANNHREEALAIALKMRSVLEDSGRTAALVTPDRALAGHVRAALSRWSLDIDDSAGVDIADTVPAVFMRLLIDVTNSQFAPIPFTAFAQHPLAGGNERATIAKAARKLEMTSLRGPRPAPGLSSLSHLIDSSKKLSGGEKAALHSLLDPLKTIANWQMTSPLSAQELLTAHIEAAEAIAGRDQLWSGDSGRGLADHLRELVKASKTMPALIPADYPAFFDSLLQGSVVRPVWGKHPRLFIWGPLEARLQRADVMILGGLNETVWPPDPGNDPWMSRPMRASFKLPPLEQRIGQAAHDLVQAAMADEVLLTRAEKIEGSPTVASRWLFRLAAAIGEMPAVDTNLMDFTALVDKARAPQPCAPPAPRPPLDARFSSLSVTGVEAWMRDPYGLYAKRILRLRKLDPVDDQPSHAEKGNLIHDILEEFLRGDGPKLGEAGRARLTEIGRQYFETLTDQPGVYAFWWPRFNQIADWFIDRMKARQGQFEPVLLEGEATALVPGTDFTLKARADRIDRNLASGGYEIIDYKTGQPPKTAQVMAGFAPQLPLEGWLAETGAFEGMPAGVVEALAYWQLSGGYDAGKISDPAKDYDVSALVREAIDGLTNLVRTFDNPETPYLAQPRPEYKGWGDYDHLARVREWQNSDWGDSDDS